MDASETNYAPNMVPPVSGFLLRFVYDGEACFVIGTDGVQLVAFHRTVEKELSLLVQEVDGDRIGVTAVSNDRQESAIGLLQYFNALLLRKLLLEPAHGPKCIADCCADSRCFIGLDGFVCIFPHGMPRLDCF